MNTDISKLPFRNNVAGIVFKNDSYLLLQRSDWPENFWKFPQGGVDENELDEDAIKRELFEEIGTKKFKIIGKSNFTNKYDWSDYAIEKAGFKWRGQFQKFFFIEFFGSNDGIKLEGDIKRYKWVKENKLREHIDHNDKNFTNYFKIVTKVIEEFSKKTL